MIKIKIEFENGNIIESTPSTGKVTRGKRAELKPLDDSSKQDFIECENCDEDLCVYDMFSCSCNKVNIDNKCNICESSSYDCEVDGSFSIKCPFKRANGE